MNLAHDPWIPVARAGANASLVSLIDLYENSDQLTDLSVSPPQRIAVMRLLTCITQRALDGPESPKAWTTCKASIAPESIAYLKANAASFELYGENPFLQVASLKPEHNATVDKLDFGLSAGNNHTLFDQEANPNGRLQSPAWQALNLLTYQCFSPGGLIGRNTWGDKDTGKNSNHSPCVESSPLHTVIRGSNLLETLFLNLIPKRLIPAENWGKPIWELDLPTPDAPDINTAQTSYLGRLVPQSRAILLEEGNSKFTLANGIQYPRFPEYREASVTVYVRESGKKLEHAYLSLNLSKHPWRELASVLALSSEQDEHIGSPVALKNLRIAGRADIEIVDLWTGGLAADKGKILDTAEWTFPLEIDTINAQYLSAYKLGVEQANLATTYLRNAIKTYKSEMTMDPKIDLNAKAQKSYWSIMDANHHLLHDCIAGDRPLAEEWYRCVKQAAIQAYKLTCPHDTSRQISAYTRGADTIMKLKNLHATPQPSDKGGTA